MVPCRYIAIPSCCERCQQQWRLLSQLLVALGQPQGKLLATYTCSTQPTAQPLQRAPPSPPHARQPAACDLQVYEAGKLPTDDSPKAKPAPTKVGRHAYYACVCTACVYNALTHQLSMSECRAMRQHDLTTARPQQCAVLMLMLLPGVAGHAPAGGSCSSRSEPPGLWCQAHPSKLNRPPPAAEAEGPGQWQRIHGDRH